jgi:hypothetical protein
VQDLNLEENAQLYMTDQAFEDLEHYDRYKMTSKDNEERESCTYRSDVVGLKRKGYDSGTGYDIKNRKLSSSNKKNSEISQLVVK